MKSFKQFLNEKFRNYRDNWYGVDPKGKLSRGNNSVYDDDYLETEPEKLTDENGKAIAWKHKLIPKKPVVNWPGEIIPKSDDVIHRGMSHEEYQNIMKTGKIASRGSGNIGKEQEGLTYFTTDPDSAGAYSSSFAMSRDKPTPKKPAYIVSIRKPHPSRIRHVEGTGEHEVGVKGDISADDIVAVHRGTVISYTPETTRITSTGKKQSITSASSQLNWEKIR